MLIRKIQLAILSLVIWCGPAPNLRGEDRVDSIFLLPPEPAFPLKSDRQKTPLLAAFVDSESIEEEERSGVTDRDASTEIDPSRRYGQEPPPRRPPITFLRNTAVLMRQGEQQLDLGLIYTVDEADFPVIIPPGSVGEGRVTQRSLFVPLTYRYGITDSLQGGVFVPLGWAHSEFAAGAADFQDSTSPIGDVVVSLSYALPKKCAGDCDLVWTSSLTLPTGDASDLFIVPDAQSGNGWLEYSSSILAIQQYDPLTIFGGFGTRYAFQADRAGLDVERGVAFDYRFGVGFGVNENISLSAQFTGSYETELEVEGRGLPGSDRDLMSLRLALTKAEYDRIIEPFVSFGLTEDSNDVQAGIVWTFR